MRWAAWFHPNLKLPACTQGVVKLAATTAVGPVMS